MTLLVALGFALGLVIPVALIALGFAIARDGSPLCRDFWSA